MRVKDSFQRLKADLGSEAQTQALLLYPLCCTHGVALGRGMDSSRTSPSKGGHPEKAASGCGSLSRLVHCDHLRCT